MTFNRNSFMEMYKSLSLNDCVLIPPIAFGEKQASLKKNKVNEGDNPLSIEGK